MTPAATTTSPSPGDIGSLLVTVVDRQTGGPPSALTVVQLQRYVGSSLQWQPANPTGTAGQFQVSAAPGPWSVFVGGGSPETNWPYVTRYIDGPTPDSLAPVVTLTAGVPSNVTVQLAAGATITGRVVDAAGAAVPDIVVAAVSEAGNESAFDIRTDATGAFTIHVPKPFPMTVRVCASRIGTVSQIGPNCGDPVDIAPGRVSSGVVVVYAESSPAPSPTSGSGEGGAGGGPELPATGGGRGPSAAVLGLLLLAVGAALVGATRRRAD